MNRRRFFQMAAAVIGALALPVPKVLKPKDMVTVTLCRWSDISPAERAAIKEMAKVMSRHLMRENSILWKLKEAKQDA